MTGPASLLFSGPRLTMVLDMPDPSWYHGWGEELLSRTVEISFEVDGSFEWNFNPPYGELRSALKVFRTFCKTWSDKVVVTCKPYKDDNCQMARAAIYETLGFTWLDKDLMILQP